VFAALVVVLVVVAMGFSPGGSSSSSSAPDTTTVASGTFFPVSKPQKLDLTAGQQAAIVALGATGAGVPASNQDHAHTDVIPEVPLSSTDEPVFELQWKAAQSAIASHDTEEKATALGYVRATAPSGGIGTHWVLWSQIAKPFDPTTPSMLLFDERRNPAVLVGFSYAVQSPTVPVGFAGPNDHWHQHRGLCVVGGWVEREQAPGPAACGGTYIAGGDFWMLHAWVVPGWDNRKGDFAPFNPKLCPPVSGTPDVNRCPV